MNKLKLKLFALKVELNSAFGVQKNKSLNDELFRNLLTPGLSFLRYKNEF